MDYEKKYKEAVNKIKNLLDDGEKNGFTIVTYKTDLESIFPELKESEDEKIRKVLIELSKEVAQEQFFINRGTNLQNVIAWLEKQGEEQPIIRWHSINEEPEEMKELFCEWESDDATWHDVAFYDKESHTFRHAKMPINVTKWIYVDELLEKQGEQKPAKTVKWSPQEESCICQLESLVKEQWRQAECVHNSVNIKKMQELMFFLKTLNPNKKPQRMISAEAKEALYDKPAWSEDNKYMIDNLIHIFKVNYPNDYYKVSCKDNSQKVSPIIYSLDIINWLKSLKQRIEDLEDIK